MTAVRCTDCNAWYGPRPEDPCASLCGTCCSKRLDFQAWRLATPRLPEDAARMLFAVEPEHAREERAWHRGAFLVLRPRGEQGADFDENYEALTREQWAARWRSDPVPPLPSGPAWRQRRGR